MTKRNAFEERLYQKLVAQGYANVNSEEIFARKSDNKYIRHWIQIHWEYYAEHGKLPD